MPGYTESVSVDAQLALALEVSIRPVLEHHLVRRPHLHAPGEVLAPHVAAEPVDVHARAQPGGQHVEWPRPPPAGMLATPGADAQSPCRASAR